MTWTRNWFWEKKLVCVVTSYSSTQGFHLWEQFRLQICMKYVYVPWGGWEMFFSMFLTRVLDSNFTKRIPPFLIVMAEFYLFIVKQLGLFGLIFICNHFCASYLILKDASRKVIRWLKNTTIRVFILFSCNDECYNFE